MGGEQGRDRDERADLPDDDQAGLAPVPSVAELRAAVRRAHPRIGTGWPVLDALTDGVALGRTTVVGAPPALRAQVLGRMAAWAAGESYRVLLASTRATTEELLLSVAAGGLGLPARALLETDSHDAWLDARLRVLDLEVHAGTDAPRRFAESMSSTRRPALAVVDGYDDDTDDQWGRALQVDGRETDVWSRPHLDPGAYPLRHGCALVLGVPDVRHLELGLRGADTYLSLTPRDDASRVEITATREGRSRTRTVLLRDGLLPPPTPHPDQVRRRGVVNIWEERLPSQITRFAGLLGAEAFEVDHAPGDDPPPDHAPGDDASSSGRARGW
ncbi:hypothetical protein [Ornithinimicrobium kibberense]|uniref:Uncharacterized protein n=1 Tax=Ornithinimicrobium kibberense TaxID=282060 RepID=A0ABV5V4H9_9MICO|nr:hypothetical protein [Ornithinimicrobium kibberense]